ncbi:MAG: cell division protein FtsL [Clostridiales bacterium]|nr:cell division protein FtsL [Clostridiales bacterium]
MKRKEQFKIILAVLFIGVILLFMVLIDAYNANVQVDNNEYSRVNADLQGEIDTLKIKVKSSNNIDSIEKVAIEQLGMVYPSEDQCIYLTDNDRPQGGFAAMLKSQAYN